MASKTTLNAKNLAALGAERLADLLLEVSKGNAGAKRRLRLELANEAGSGNVAREIRKRLSTIARMDRIVVLDEGGIAEQGTHEELLALQSLYAGFWARQSGGFIGA